MLLTISGKESDHVAMSHTAERKIRGEAGESQYGTCKTVKANSDHMWHV